MAHRPTFEQQATTSEPGQFREESDSVGNVQAFPIGTLVSLTENGDFDLDKTTGIRFGSPSQSIRKDASGEITIYDAGLLHIFQIGSVAELTIGANLLAMVQGVNSVALDWSDSLKLHIKVEATDQVTFTNGTLEPVTTNDIDLGTSSKEFKAGFFSGEVLANTFKSDVATGTAPFTIASTTQVANLKSEDSDKVDGLHVGTSGSAVPDLSAANTWTATQRLDSANKLEFNGTTEFIHQLVPGVLNLEATGAVTCNVGGGVAELSVSSIGVVVQGICQGTTLKSIVVTGTAPLTITSTTVVPNLNVDQVDGKDSTDLVLVDGTQALSADWDAGAFKIRAQTFESDVTTGTAPLVIASTTVVSNLNADLLDGNEASAFLTAVPTGTVIQDQVNDTPSSNTASADPVMALVLSTTTGVASCYYEAWGAMEGAANNESGWTIEVQDPSSVVLKTITVKQDATGAGDFFHIPFFIRGRDATPDTGAAGYHLALTEDSGAGTLIVKSAYLHRVAS